MPEWGSLKDFNRKNTDKEPKRRVVYNLKGKKENYVGSTNNPSERLKKHMRDPKKSWATKYRVKEVGPLDSRKSAEGRAGAKSKPNMNKRLPKVGQWGI
jgi:hypothetical protein